MKKYTYYCVIRLRKPTDEKELVTISTNKQDAIKERNDLAHMLYIVYIAKIELRYKLTEIHVAMFNDALLDYALKEGVRL